MEMQKCLHLYDALSKKNPGIIGEYTISEKLDGWWVAIEHNKDTGWKTPISSSGRIISSLDFIDLNELKIFPKLDKNFLLIAEVTHPEYPIFSDLNGKLNRKLEKTTGVILNIHDMYFPNLPLLTAYERSNMLYDLYDSANFSLLHSNTLDFKVNIVKSLLLSGDINDWLKEFDKVVARGGEGIVAKQVFGLYMPGKRNSSLIKIKEEITLDLLCTDLIHSFGAKGEPSLVAVCKSANRKQVSINIPKHTDMVAFAEHPDAIIGKVVEVKAMKRLEDSLREPRFKAVRHDKNKSEIDVI